MPDLDHYRRRYPELTDEERERLRWSLRGLAREMYRRYREEKRYRPASPAVEDEPLLREVACGPK